MKKESMRSARLPADSWEKGLECAKPADIKYSGEFSAPEDYKKAVEGLSNYTKRNVASH